MQATDIAPLSPAAAQRALDRAVHDGGLVVESHRACDEADAFLMRVHPGPGFGIAKQVRVQVLPTRQVGEVLTVGFRWEATGPTGRLFPALDGNLVLSPAAGDTTAVTVTAVYHPPLGRLGESLDHTLLAGLADTTISALVQAVIAKLVVLADDERDPTPS